MPRIKKEIDTTRNLCASCLLSRMSCEPKDAFEGEEQNIYKCSSYKKNSNPEIPLYRAGLGSPFYVYIYKDKKDPSKGFITNERIERNSRIDNVYYEVRNYFMSEADCQKEIDRLHILKNIG